MKLVPWMRFTWDLTKLPSTPGAAIEPYRIRMAVRDEETAVTRAIISAFSLDLAWADTMKNMQGWMEEQIASTFAHRGTAPSCLVVTHGSRIIGASLLDSSRESESHLVTGPCILSEYRCRGIGTALLGQSLAALHEAGLTQARALIKSNVPAAKFIYPKFKSESEMIDFVPEYACP